MKKQSVIVSKRSRFFSSHLYYPLPLFPTEHFHVQAKRLMHKHVTVHQRGRPIRLAGTWNLSLQAIPPRLSVVGIEQFQS
jgi:hypothetical protein